VDRFQLGYVDQGCALASVGNLIVCVLRGEVTIERLRALRRDTERLVAIYGTERGGITVVEGAAVTDVSKEVRVESAALMRDLPSVVTVTVIEGRGFRAVAARAIVSAMALLARTRDANKLFDTVEAAARYLVPRIPVRAGEPKLTSDEVIAIVERTRAAIASR
jgi:hypothetical protein